jgi:hypothetical protein
MIGRMEGLRILGVLRIALNFCLLDFAVREVLVLLEGWSIKLALLIETGAEEWEMWWGVVWRECSGVEWV